MADADPRACVGPNEACWLFQRVLQSSIRVQRTGRGEEQVRTRLNLGNGERDALSTTKQQDQAGEKTGVSGAHADA